MDIVMLMMMCLQASSPWKVTIKFWEIAYPKPGLTSYMMGNSCNSSTGSLRKVKFIVIAMVGKTPKSSSTGLMYSGASSVFGYLVHTVYLCCSVQKSFGLFWPCGYDSQPVQAGIAYRELDPISNVPISVLVKCWEGQLLVEMELVNLWMRFLASASRDCLSSWIGHMRIGHILMCPFSVLVRPWEGQSLAESKLVKFVVVACLLVLCVHLPVVVRSGSYGCLI